MPLQELPYPNSVAALFESLRHLPWSCWLDSGEPFAGSEAQGRYHVLAADPRLRFQAAGKNRTRITQREGGERVVEHSLLDVLREHLSGGVQIRPPFSGGAVGYLSYNYGQELEGVASVHPSCFPAAAFGLYDWALVVDQVERRCWVAGQKNARWPERRMLDQWVGLANAEAPWQSWKHQIEPEPDLSFDGYARNFRRIQDYLREGDCYQVNYAQRFSCTWKEDAWPLYLQMRQHNPAPFGAYMDLGFAQILSSSPEHFLGVQDGQVVTHPIKGTRPRGDDCTADDVLARQLLCNPKDQAENLMIVDLLRNDLGRVCQPGSICVPQLYRLERQPTVQHLVSRVKGRLARDKDALDVLAACFPGGSITGAPKHRAMQIIDELEDFSRDIYCGSIGWIGYDGDMQTNIAIRTVLIYQGRAYYWAGGGIVADSVLEQEYQESLDKARALFNVFRNREMVSH